MTGKADFTAEEWKVVLPGPPSAGLMVATAQRGGTFRESASIAGAYTAARKQHGESELLDAIVSEKPEMDHGHYHSVEEVKEHSLQHLRDATDLLDQKATPEEVGAYKHFVLDLAQKVAEAHREGFLGMSGERVSESETTAVAEIARTLGVTNHGTDEFAPTDRSIE